MHGYWVAVLGIRSAQSIRPYISVYFSYTSISDMMLQYKKNKLTLMPAFSVIETCSLAAAPIQGCMETIHLNVGELGGFFLLLFHAFIKPLLILDLKYC